MQNEPTDTNRDSRIAMAAEVIKEMGLVIREKRLERGLKAAQVATWLGMAESTYYVYELKAGRATLHKIMSMAYVLGLSFGDVVAEAERRAVQRHLQEVARANPTVAS